MFKDNIRYLRKREHLTQTQLAERLGVSKSTIAMYETGKREPDFIMAESIADFFNVSMDFLACSTGKAVVNKSDLNLDSYTSYEIQLINCWREANDDEREAVAFALRKHGFVYAPSQEKNSQVV